MNIIEVLCNYKLLECSIGILEVNDHTALDLDWNCAQINEEF